MKFSKRFVCASLEYSTFEKHIQNPQFRKSFMLENVPESAEITICGLGYYELYINGENITKGYMAPYRSNPDHYLYYDHYDIAEQLQPGENVVGILLGNGLLNANYTVWDFDKAVFRSSPKVALCLEINGESLFDAQALKCTDSPITYEEFHLGEYYDARLELDGWKKPGYNDNAWNAVIPAITPKGEARIPDCEPIGIIDIHHPARIIKTETGYVYDFVVNCAGLCELKIKGERGQEVTLYHGEALRNGKLDIRNISFSRCYEQAGNPESTPQCNRYILKGGETETYMPHFSYHGFRFVEVTGITEEQATPDLLTFYEMSSSLEQIADFKCDNADINAIFDATMRSDRANFIYFPTDCPQREKNGWTGDAALSAEQLLIYFNAARSLKEWLRNVFKSQNEEGAIPGIIPTDTWGFAWGSGPAWDNVMFELTDRIYQYTGDTDFVREAAPYLLKYLRYMESKRDEEGLLHYGLGDWCHIHLPSKMVSAQVPQTDTITCKSICDKAVRLFTIIGDHTSAAYAQRLSDELKAAYNAKFPTPRNQSIAAMCLYYNMVETEQVAEVFKKLKFYIHSYDDHMDVGVLGERALFRVLGENHETELALKMILNPTFPSFKVSVEKGMTSLPEDFKYLNNRIDEMTDDDAMIASLNHHFWGDIVAFFMRHLAGIQIESTTKARIAPDFVSSINNVTAYTSIPKGRISVEYKKCDIMVSMTVTIPAGVEATVEVPTGYQLSYGKLKCKAGENTLVFCKL